MQAPCGDGSRREGEGFGPQAGLALPCLGSPAAHWEGFADASSALSRE